MFSFLEKLRNLPEYKRKIFAIFFSALSVFLILSVWVFSKTTAGDIFSSEIVVENKRESDNSPISYMAQNANAIFSDIKGIFSDMKETATAFKDSVESESSLGEADLLKETTSSNEVPSSNEEILSNATTSSDEAGGNDNLWEISSSSEDIIEKVSTSTGTDTNFE